MDLIDRIRLVIGDSTIDNFAASINQPAQRVKDVLRGKQKPPADMLYAVHMQHGVDLNWLFDGGSDVPKMNLSVRERSLLDNYRAAAEDGKRAIEHTSAAVKKQELVVNVRKPERKAA
jgi:hypothetical protein